MKIIKTFFALALAALTVSCANMTDDISPTSAELSAGDGMAYISVSVANHDHSNRTILPKIDISNLVLKGGLSGTEQTLLASADSLDDMEGKLIKIQTGEWNFTLTATVSGTAFTSGTVTKTIESSGENPLSFTLVQADTSETNGILDFSMKFTGTEGVDYEVTWKDENGPTIHGPYTSGGNFRTTAQYSAGTHTFEIEFRAKNVNSDGGSSEILNIYKSVFRIEKGLTTKASVENFNLNDVYSIIYDGYESEVKEGVPTADSLTGLITLKFNRKSSAISLPNLTNTDLTFSGWYKDQAFTEGPLESISPASNLSNLTLYAKWTADQTGSISNLEDYSFTFALKDQDDNAATSVTPGEESTFTLIPTASKKGSAIPLTINESGKTIVDENEVTWTASLWNDGKQVPAAITVSPDYSSGKISVTIPAINLQDRYILKITANYLGLSHDANFPIKCETVSSLLTVPLTIEAKAANVSVTFINKSAGPVTYKINGGSGATIPSGESSGGILLTVAGTKISFYGDNASYGALSSSDCSNISCSDECYVYGNIMSLVKSSGFEKVKTLTGEYTFAYLFKNNEKIMNKEGEDLFLPATTLMKRCYTGIFYGCKGLTKAPTLPATTLATSCYSSMFESCEGITEAPELPETSLAESCYASMFRNCKNLTQAPTLPATTLTTQCYYLMFDGCESLTEAPELPADTMKDSCYREMFKSCKSLTRAPALPATTLADCCYYMMFTSCSGLLEAPASLPATTLTKSCYFAMFLSCEKITTAPSLPATTLASQCYLNMFNECSRLTAAPDLPATTIASSCYSGMFGGCTSLTTAPALPATELASYCYREMFKGCTSLTEAPTLTATTLTNSCYKEMFKDCSSLNKVTCLATNISATDCTTDWLSGVAITGTFTKSPDMSEDTVGYWTSGASGIPSGWTEATPVNNVSLGSLTGDYTAQDGDVLSGTTSRVITIASGATVTLNGATMNKGIICEGDATIILEGDNTVKADSSKKDGSQATGAAVRVGPKGTTLTIKGEGKLTATVSYTLGAAIGLDGVWATSQEGGTIVIESGTINTTTHMGAGIGCGSIYGSSLHATLEGIVIKGGTITTTITDNSGNGADYSATSIGYGYSYDTQLKNRSEGRFNVNKIEIYDTITSLDLHSLANPVVYKHGNTDVTENKETYFNITENGRARVITPKN